MSVKITYMSRIGLSPDPLGRLSVSNPRKSETVAVPGTSVSTALDGEIAILTSDEATIVNCAYGSTPNAAAIDLVSGTTSAGFWMVPNVPYVIAPAANDKFDFKVKS